MNHMLVTVLIGVLVLAQTNTGEVAGIVSDGSSAPRARGKCSSALA